METSKKFVFSEIFFWIMSAGVIMLFYVLNILTPLIADDYSRSMGIRSIADITAAVYREWLGWTGRSIVLFLTFPCLMIGKPFFNVANTLVYCAFILLTYFHITGSLRKFKPVIFFAINVFYWFFVPAWGQNFLWLTGSCGYLWPMVIILLFLMPFRKKTDSKDYTLNTVPSMFFFILGLVAGWSYENIGAAVLSLLIAYFVMKGINRDKITLFEITGTIGFLIGFVLLIAAPGNYVRTDFIKLIIENWGEGTGHGGYYDDAVVIMLCKRFIKVSLLFLRNHSFAFITAALLAFDLLYYQKRRLNQFSYFYVLTAFASAYSLILSPVFPDRAFLPVTVFLGITLGTVLMRFDGIPVPAAIKKRCVYPAIVLLLLGIFSFVSVYKAGKNIVGIYLKQQKRIEYILAEKEKGNLDLEVKAPIPVYDKHAALYELNDIVDDEKSWPNTIIAGYFGLRSIKGRNSSDPWQ